MLDSLNSDNEEILDVLDPDLNFLQEALPADLCKYYTVSELNRLESKENYFSLLNYNIRSFHRNGNSFLSMLNSLNHNFECIVLSETWNNEANVDLCMLPNYAGFHTYRPKDHVYSISGGISVLCSSSLYANQNVQFSVCNSNIETCVVDLVSKGTNITIVAVYRPPQGSKLEFIHELDQILNSICTMSSRVTVVGDINLNLYDINDNHLIDFTSKLYSKGFMSLINEATRFPNGENVSDPSILDHIWTNNFNVPLAGIIDYDLTDHLPTFCVFNFPNIDANSDKIKIQNRPYSENNLQKLINELEIIDWNSLLDYNDPETCLGSFIDKINSLYRKCFPLKTKFISHKRLKNRWISQDIKLLINNKSESFKKFRNGLITRAENNRFKNQINAKINKAKNKYYIDALTAFRNNMKKSWNLIQGLMGRKKSRRDIISLMDGNVELTETIDIVDKFADYFSSIGSKLESDLEHSNQSPCLYINRNPHSFSLFPVTHIELTRIISKLKITRTDINHIPVKIFKSVSHCFGSTLVDIINSSFYHGIFPKSLKIAKITPIYKKGDVKHCSNFRPISSLPFVSKIFERCMANRIMSFFSKFQLFSENQFGFLKNRSTQDAVFNFSENIYDALNAKYHNISILIDLKAAFDTVNHNILLRKLELYGIRGHGLEWLKSYLTDRQFNVGLQKTFSTTKTVNIGIPQGSILGPILFIIYNNDLPLVSNILSSTLYADDTNFSISHSEYDVMIPLLNSELEKIHDWTLANRLTINAAKTELLLFTNSRDVTPSNTDVVLNGTPVGYVDHARFLGVIIDSKFNFKLHINNVVTKVSKHGGILYKIRNNLPLPARIMYYNSFVLPYLTFNIIHWGKTNITHLSPLIIAQKRIIRTMCDADYLDSTTPLFYRLKLLKLEDLYKFYAIMDTHKKIALGQYNVQHNRNTRNCHLAVPKFHSLSRTEQSITNKGPNLWNNLPAYLREISSQSILKIKLKEYLLSFYAM